MRIGLKLQENIVFITLFKSLCRESKQKAVEAKVLAMEGGPSRRLATDEHGKTRKEAEAEDQAKDLPRNFTETKHCIQSRMREGRFK